MAFGAEQRMGKHFSGQRNIGKIAAMRRGPRIKAFFGTAQRKFCTRCDFSGFHIPDNIHYFYYPIYGLRRNCADAGALTIWCQYSRP
jgi:hypothetical protein